MRLNPAETLNHPETARRILIVLGAAILLFFVHHLLHISPSFVALGAAACALAWVQPDLDEMLKKIEWSVLIFFASLFIMVGGLESAGVLEAVIGLLGRGSNVSPVFFGVVLIWVVAALSAVVDNIPITIALIPVIKGLGEGDGYHATLVGAGIRRRLWRQWDDRALDHQYYCCKTFRKNAHAHHFTVVAAARTASDDNDLCHCQCLICALLPTVLTMEAITACLIKH